MHLETLVNILDNMRLAFCIVKKTQLKDEKLLKYRKTLKMSYYNHMFCEMLQINGQITSNEIVKIFKEFLFYNEEENGTPIFNNATNKKKNDKDVSLLSDINNIRKDNFYSPNIGNAFKNIDAGDTNYNNSQSKSNPNYNANKNFGINNNLNMNNINKTNVNTYSNFHKLNNSSSNSLKLVSRKSHLLRALDLYDVLMDYFSKDKKEIMQNTQNSFNTGMNNPLSNNIVVFNNMKKFYEKENNDYAELSNKSPKNNKLFGHKSNGFSEVKEHRFMRNNLFFSVRIQEVEDYLVIIFENLDEEKKQIQNKLIKSIKSQYIITISHELNNPLNGLIHCIDELGMEDSQKRDNIYKKIKRFKFMIKFFLKNIVTNFRFFLKEPLQKKLSNINLGYILESIKKSLFEFYEYKNISVQHDFSNLNKYILQYDYFYFRFLLKNIFMYFYYKVPRDDKFTIEILKESDLVLDINANSNLHNNIDNLSKRNSNKNNNSNSNNSNSYNKNNNNNNNTSNSHNNSNNTQHIISVNQNITSNVDSSVSESVSEAQDLNYKLEIYKSHNYNLSTTNNNNNDLNVNFEKDNFKNTDRSNFIGRTINLDDRKNKNSNTHNHNNINFNNVENKTNNLRRSPYQKNLSFIASGNTNSNNNNNQKSQTNLLSGRNDAKQANKKLVIIFKTEQQSFIARKSSRNMYDKAYLENFDIENSIQTLEMLIESINKISKLLGIKIDFSNFNKKNTIMQMNLSYTIDEEDSVLYNDINEYSDEYDKYKANCIFSINRTLINEDKKAYLNPTLNSLYMKSMSRNLNDVNGISANNTNINMLGYKIVKSLSLFDNDDNQLNNNFHTLAGNYKFDYYAGYNKNNMNLFNLKSGPAFSNVLNQNNFLGNANNNMSSGQCINNKNNNNNNDDVFNIKNTNFSFNCNNNFHYSDNMNNPSYSDPSKNKENPSCAFSRNFFNSKNNINLNNNLEQNSYYYSSSYQDPTNSYNCNANNNNTNNSSNSLSQSLNNKFSYEIPINKKNENKELEFSDNKQESNNESSFSNLKSQISSSVNNYRNNKFLTNDTTEDDTKKPGYFIAKDKLTQSKRFISKERNCSSLFSKQNSIIPNEHPKQVNKLVSPDSNSESKSKSMSKSKSKNKHTQNFIKEENKLASIYNINKIRNMSNNKYDFVASQNNNEAILKPKKSKDFIDKTQTSNFILSQDDSWKLNNFFKSSKTEIISPRSNKMYLEEAINFNDYLNPDYSNNNNSKKNKNNSHFINNSIFVKHNHNNSPAKRSQKKEFYDFEKKIYKEELNMLKNLQLSLAHTDFLPQYQQSMKNINNINIINNNNDDKENNFSEKKIFGKVNAHDIDNENLKKIRNSIYAMNSNNNNINNNLFNSCNLDQFNYSCANIYTARSSRSNSNQVNCSIQSLNYYSGTEIINKDIFFHQSQKNHFFNSESNSCKNKNSSKFNYKTDLILNIRNRNLMNSIFANESDSNKNLTKNKNFSSTSLGRRSNNINKDDAFNIKNSLGNHKEAKRYDRLHAKKGSLNFSSIPNDKKSIEISDENITNNKKSSLGINYKSDCYQGSLEIQKEPSAKELLEQDKNELLKNLCLSNNSNNKGQIFFNTYNTYLNINNVEKLEIKNGQYFSNAINTTNNNTSNNNNNNNNNNNHHHNSINNPIQKNPKGDDYLKKFCFNNNTKSGFSSSDSNSANKKVTATNKYKDKGKKLNLNSEFMKIENFEHDHSKNLSIKLIQENKFQNDKLNIVKKNNIETYEEDSSSCVEDDIDLNEYYDNFDENNLNANLNQIHKKIPKNILISNNSSSSSIIDAYNHCENINFDKDNKIPLNTKNITDFNTNVSKDANKNDPITQINQNINAFHLDKDKNVICNAYDNGISLMNHNINNINNNNTNNNCKNNSLNGLNNCNNFNNTNKNNLINIKYIRSPRLFFQFKKPVLKESKKPTATRNSEKSELKSPLDILSNKICECNDILLVDDELFNLSSMKFLLKKKNLNADTAMNGRESIERIKEKSSKNCSICKAKEYKIIFMDIMMPEVDGIEASNIIQGMVDKGVLSNNIKILILTAHDSEIIRNRTKEIKIIYEFISKPVKKSIVDEMLNKYLFNTFQNS